MGPLESGKLRRTARAANLGRRVRARRGPASTGLPATHRTGTQAVGPPGWPGQGCADHRDREEGIWLSQQVSEGSPPIVEATHTGHKRGIARGSPMNPVYLDAPCRASGGLGNGPPNFLPFSPRHGPTLATTPRRGRRSRRGTRPPRFPGHPRLIRRADRPGGPAFFRVDCGLASGRARSCD